MAGRSGSDRLLLQGVPRIAFYSGGARCPEDITYPACLRAALEYLGELPGCAHLPRHQAGSPIHCGYAWLMGLTGQAFSLVWEPGWSPANGDVRWLAADPAEPLRRGLEAAGHEGSVFVRSARWPNEADLRRIIIAHLDERLPLVAIGLAGPPEASLITGYDAAGDVLLGWSFFQDMAEFNVGLSFEPSGPFRQRDWYSHLEALVAIGQRITAPVPLGEAVREALRRGLEQIRTARIAGRPAGLAAYDAWSQALLEDGPALEPDSGDLCACYDVHDNAVGNLAELRWYGSVFLSQAANASLAGDVELLRAAACMAQEHSLMWQAWAAVGGNGRDAAMVRAFAQPEVRQRLAAVIRASRDACASTADHLEAALR